MKSETSKIGIYEKALNPKLSILQKIDIVSKLGFDGIQLSIDADNLLPYIWTDEFCSTVTEKCEKTGVEIFSISLSAHRYYSLAATDVHIRDFSVDLLIKTILFAKKLNAGAVMLAGYDSWNTPPLQNSWSIFRENLMKTLVFAEKNNIMLPIEIVDGNFINNCEKALKMINEIDSGCLSIYYDTANCIASGFDPEIQLEYAKVKLYGIHMKDTKDRDFKSNLPLGSGDVDFVKVFKKLSTFGFSGEIVLENWYTNSECIKKYSDNLNYIKSLINKYLINHENILLRF